MATSTDWSQLDSASSHDLFGGDLFGDELIDIYNSAAVVETVGSMDVTSEIPSLILPSKNDASTAKDNVDASLNHPGAQIAMEASAMDDGLGAFRPSTSFNDFTTLHPPEGTVADTNSTPVAPVGVTSSGEATRIVNASRKREVPAAGAAAPGTSTKKQRVTVGGKKAQVAAVGVPVPKAGSQSAGQVAHKLRQKKEAAKTAGSKNSKDNTPNPLGLGAKPAPSTATVTAPAPVPKSVPLAISKPATAPPPAIPAALPSALPAAAPATVTPRPPPPAAGVVKSEPITSEAAATTAAAAAAAAVPLASATTTSAPSAPATTSTTEADFKSVAQAAVTNLILNVGTSSKTEPVYTASNATTTTTTTTATAAATTTTTTSNDNDVFPLSKKIDTSTAHIKALTSSNWVTACSGGTDPASAAAAAAVADSKANNRARRQNLTPDERARQNRDRNREHARNTRLRKKAYVEELKRTLTELVAQRDASELEKCHTAQRELEQREVRFRVMEEFLKLRGRNEVNFARWVAILEDGFTLTIPTTDFRKMVKEENNSDPNSTNKSPKVFQQVLSGPNEVMTDSCNFSDFLQTLGTASDDLSSPPKPAVTFTYGCERKNFFMDGANAVLEWTASSVGGIDRGAPYELTLKGTMRAKFCPASNKLLSAQILFDTGIVTTQIQDLIVTSAEDTNNEACAATAAAAAAQAAASEADALLDSIQMPQLTSAVPTAITVQTSADPSTTVSVSSSEEKAGDSDDENTPELTAVEVQPVIKPMETSMAVKVEPIEGNDTVAATPRRSLRNKE